MYTIKEEKENLTATLSDCYSRDLVDMEEYERILEYINKIETKKEISIIKKVIQEYNIYKDEVVVQNNTQIMLPKHGETHAAVFSWRTSHINGTQGNSAQYTSLFGANRIFVDNLPAGRTVMRVNSIFGMTEIIVSQKVKIVNKTTQIFSGVFTPNDINDENEDLPELYIIGSAIFGDITVKTIGEFSNEQKREKEFEEIYREKLLQKMVNKLK